MLETEESVNSFEVHRKHLDYIQQFNNEDVLSVLVHDDGSSSSFLQRMLLHHGDLEQHNVNLRKFQEQRSLVRQARLLESDPQPLSLLSSDESWRTVDHWTSYWGTWSAWTSWS